MQMVLSLAYMQGLLLVGHCILLQAYLQQSSSLPTSVLCTPYMSTSVKMNSLGVLG